MAPHLLEEAHSDFDEHTISLECTSFLEARAGSQIYPVLITTSSKCRLLLRSRGLSPPKLKHHVETLLAMMHRLHRCCTSDA